MSTATTAQPTDFFTVGEERAHRRPFSLEQVIEWNLRRTLALLTLVPLFSIVFLVLKNGLPLLSWSVFTELPPAAG